MLCHLYKPIKIKINLNNYQIKTQVYSSSRLQVAASPNGTKKMVKSTKEKLYVITNQLLSNFDVQMMKGYCRNKMPNSKTLPFLGKKSNESEIYQDNENPSHLDNILKVQEKSLPLLEKSNKFDLVYENISGIEKLPNETKKIIKSTKEKLYIVTNQLVSNLDVQVAKDYFKTLSLLRKKSNESDSYQEYQKIPRMDSIQKFQKKSLTFMRNKFNVYFKSYQKFTGMDKILIAHEKCVVLQEKLNEAQHRRRELLIELISIRRDLEQIQSDISNCNRSEGSHLDLVKKQIEITHNKQEKQERAQIADTEERELFAQFVLAVKLYHEQERYYNNKLYWKIIGTTASVLLGILATVLERYRNNESVEIKNKLYDVLKENSELKKLNVVADQENFMYRKVKSIYRYFVPK